MDKKVAGIIFSDIDGTLLNSSHHIGTCTRKKVLALDQRGIPFILVSARMPDGVYLVQKELGTRRPVICYSGGLVLDEEGKALYSCRMKLALAGAAEQLIKKEYPNICCNIYGGNQWVVKDDQNPWVIREETITRSKAEVGDVQSVFAGDGGVHKLLLMGEVEEIAQAEKELKREFPELSVLRSNQNYLEIMDGKVNKAQGVHVLCQYYGISKEEAAAFGDGENDLDMLLAVKYGYVMANALPYVREKVGRVTKSNDEEGIYAVIQEW